MTRTPDVMDRLAAARPVDLDPWPDAERRRRDLETALAGPAPGPSQTQPRVARRAGLGLVLMAAGTAAAVAVVTLDGGTSAPRTPRPAATASTARSVLLSAAKTAGAQAMGRYWRVHSVSGRAYRTGQGAHGYTVFAGGREYDEWRAASMDDPDLSYTRDLGARPATVADRTAWRRAGAPGTFRVRSGRDRRTFSGRNGAWHTSRTTPAYKRAHRDDYQTPSELRRYAADPARFRRLLFHSPMTGHGRRAAMGLVFGVRFLTEQPVPPAVRAKAFRALADLPGVRYAGRVTTPDGRSGIAIAARETANGEAVDEQVVFDPKTYRVIADQRVAAPATGTTPGTPLSYEIIKSAGWTNATPHRP